MITTNIDNLVFQTASGGIHLYHGKQEEDLQRALVKGQRALLAIHGDLANMASLVFSKQEYDQIYGKSDSFNPNAALPRFLAQVFDHHRLLFIGCSLNRDRVLDVLADRPDKRTHYAILHQDLNTLAFRRRLSSLYLEPLWITDYAQIENILHRRDLKTKMEQIKLERFTPDEALELCREVLGGRFVVEDQGLYQQIAQRLAYLPVALRPAYQLMAFKPRYPAAELLTRLNGPEILSQFFLLNTDVFPVPPT